MNLEQIQSALAPAGIQSERIAELWWVFVVVLGVVYLLVMAALAVALLRKKRAEERRLTWIVSTSLGATVVILFVLLIQSTVTGREMTEIDATNDLTIRLTAHQFWWEVTYLDPDPSKTFTTANEIHLPVGRPVTVELASADVIHSFWVPSLHGKRDLIPGLHATTVLRADHAGVYRGQCSEFCGHGHAKMALYVVAEEPQAFRAWAEAERRPASIPDTALEARGHDLFVSGPCAMCHSIRGTTAGSNNGPDLTHLASRLSLAAGSLPNTAGHLADWIVDSQAIKPGNKMPPLTLPPGEVRALLAYLESLE